MVRHRSNPFASINTRKRGGIIGRKPRPRGPTSLSKIHPPAPPSMETKDRQSSSVKNPEDGSTPRPYAKEFDEEVKNVVAGRSNSFLPSEIFLDGTGRIYAPMYGRYKEMVGRNFDMNWGYQNSALYFVRLRRFRRKESTNLPAFFHAEKIAMMSSPKENSEPFPLYEYKVGEAGLQVGLFKIKKILSQTQESPLIAIALEKV